MREELKEFPRDIVLPAELNKVDKVRNYSALGFKNQFVTTSLKDWITKAIADNIIPIPVPPVDRNQPYVTKDTDYTLQLTDYTVDFTVATSTATLPTAIGNTQVFNIANSSGGTITVNTTASQTMYLPGGPVTSLVLNDGESLTIQSTGTNWRAL